MPPQPVPPMVVTTPPAAAEPVPQPGRRVALVIGNSEYRNVPRLPNPVNDAIMMRDALGRSSFESVDLIRNATREQLLSALHRFADRADSADWAVIFYSGHGVEVGGTNYLVPVDARLRTNRDVEFEAVELDKALRAIEHARKLRLIILDACRDNPFLVQMARIMPTRSVGRGLARVEPDGGMLIAYAAKHGEIALDGEGSSSPFTDALVKRMRTPRLEIRRMFDLIRDDVMAATSRRQQPFTYGSLPGSEDFYFTVR